MEPANNHHSGDSKSLDSDSKANIYSMFSGTILDIDDLVQANNRILDEWDQNGVHDVLGPRTAPSPPEQPESESNHLSESEAEDLKDSNLCYRALRRCNCCYERLLHWPRISAVILGVTFPMLFLTLLSAVFGLFLAYAEAPLEFQLNDNSLAQNARERHTLNAVVNITDIIPTLCLRMFIKQVNVSSIPSFLRQHIFLSNVSLTPITDISSTEPSSNGTLDDVVTFNSTALFEFMRSCGAEVAPLVESLFRKTSSAYRDIVASELTFDWIRCYPGAQNSGIRSAMSGSVNIEDFRYDAQLDWYEKSWKQSQLLYYEILLDQYLAQGNTTPEDAKYQATMQSFNLATGAKGCTLNVPASGWFWFTVLSTCGYGNAAPQSSAGRAMVYTLGFLSIMAFAGILATAGYVASAIFDDAMVRLRLRATTHPLVAMVTWASLYYLWMLAIAAVTINWKHARMGDTNFGMSQGYWFAYISSTTVGLGDIWFEPEVFLYRDLFLFPIMWLVGFVLAAAFLAKFAETWLFVVGRRSFVSDALSQLHKTELLHELPSARTVIVDRVNCCGRGRRRQAHQVSKAPTEQAPKEERQPTTYESNFWFSDPS